MQARNTTTSQIDGIAAYINSGKALTSMEALTNFGCFRLAARVKELKDRRGMAITTTIKTNPVSGNKYASYSLTKPVQLGDAVVVRSITNKGDERMGIYKVGQRGVVMKRTDIIINGHVRIRVAFDGGQSWYVNEGDLRHA